MFNLEAGLMCLLATDGSDLHLKVPSLPLIRRHGKLVPIVGTEPLAPADTEQVLKQMLSEETAKWEEFQRENEVDFSYSICGTGRFRVNAFRQRGSITLVCRAIPEENTTIDDLGLPPVIGELADEERGIILVTGTTGSGKSTTLAAMIDRINSRESKHIVTIEDPIEFLHPDKRSIVNQREVGQDTTSFKRALRRVLRQDPDVILIGEMRDEETVSSAMSAAETGHLVLSTLHTSDAGESINRVMEFFPASMHLQVRAMLAGNLKGVISQRLVRTPDGEGRLAVCEVLRMTGRIHDMIMNPDDTSKLTEAIAEGKYYGMQTFDQHLMEHVLAGRIDMDEALKAATSPHDLRLLVTSAGQRPSSIEQIMSA